ncbi:uncharacterized protein PITG_15171 [Phytophthora infestans T30-4]|uniref:Uncharacterized protein n=1 Tax=Phytophthora infestans (strain T30-4) TaxID=403677 RepID=D0NQ38_PHYIT|nr:uncharacterized protein PITG_15171 [Phytophthora infestans T30-4]EEY62770.1 conserved hypothetical protein [Phytophthora infestans T30-4]|eukprot:XP_002898645.1 conserved hypothetical protein [Phytophthora infestans T30-4]
MDASLKAQFWNEGYLVENLRLPPHTLEKAKQEIEQLDFRPIFGEVYEVERDHFRLQAPIATFGPATNKIYKRVKGIVEGSDKNWYTKKSISNALKSLPGGLRQGIHLDFPSFETSKAKLEKGIVQASVIIALQSDTQFYVYPGCFGVYAEMEKCKLKI